MKLTLTTTYENISEEWLDWYLNRLRNSGFPYVKKAADALEKGKSYSWSDQDPEDPKIVATTSYRLDNV